MNVGSMPMIPVAMDGSTGVDSEEGGASGETTTPIVSGGLDDTTAGETWQPPTSSGGLGESGDDAVDTTGSAVDPCDPVPTDDACFTCARMLCCVQVTACADDPICQCTADCIAAGGESGTCNDGCGGTTVATINLMGCANFQCDACSSP